MADDSLIDTPLEEASSTPFESIGGRKMAAILATLVVAIIVMAVKGDVPTNFAALLGTVMGFFVAGNAVEHVTACRVEQHNIQADVSYSQIEAQKAMQATPMPAMDQATKQALDQLTAATEANQAGVLYIVNYIQKLEAAAAATKRT